MATQVEEQQARDFLKRAEIRTMKKDLQALREVDAVKERNKIVKIKTLEEQEKEQQKKLEQIEENKLQEERAKREEVLQRNEAQEELAEKDLKNYATEQERQQIFLLESQKLALENQVDANNKDKDPALKLEKNKILLQINEVQDGLNKITDEEKKLENEQKLIIEKHQTASADAEKKSLEQRRSELDDQIQETEKKRWEVEKQMQDLDSKTKEIDQSLTQIVNENNELRNKILGIDKSLRDIYSGVIARVEEKRRGQAEEQKAKREELSRVRTGEKEKVQREQWRGQPQKDFFEKAAIPIPARQKIMESAQSEEEQRQKFINDVENWAQPPVAPKK
jgi:hypothetical protein